MARYLYGNTPADFTLGPSGRIIPNVSLTVWTAESGGSQVTDLLDYANAPVASVTSDDAGLVRFYGPDEVDSTLWIQAGSGTRLAVRPVNLPRPALEVGTVTTGTADVTLTPDGLDGYTMDLVLPSAGANGVNTAAIQDSAVTAAKIANDTITATQVAANAIGSSELADNAVDTAAIADGAVTPAKMQRQVGNLLTENQAKPTTAGAYTLANATEGAAGVYTATGAGDMIGYTTAIPVAGGETYTAVVTATVPNRYVRVMVLWKDSGGSAIGSLAGSGKAFDFPVSGTGAATVTLVAPSNAVTAEFYPFYSGAGSGGDVITLTKASFHKGTGGQWALPGTPILGLTDAPLGNLLTLNQATGTDALADTSDFGASLDCTLSSSAAWAQSGSRSLALVCATRSYDYLYADVNDTPISVTPSAVYTARAVAYSYPTPRSAAVALIWYDSGASVISVATGSYAATNTSTGTPVTVTATAPPGAATAVMRLYVADATRSTTDVHYFDELSFHKGAAGVWSLPGYPVVGLSRIAVNSATDLSGTGTPEGVVTAAPGSTWLQTDSTTDVKGWIRWVKATGTGNTGWIAGAEADTGPRVVTVDGAGWSGALLLRRIGSQVQVYTDSSHVPIMPASGTQIMTLPTGFTAAFGTYPGVAYNLWTGATVGVRVAGTSSLSVNLEGDLLATRGLAPLLTFISPAGWPTSLPGVAG